MFGTAGACGQFLLNFSCPRPWPYRYYTIWASATQPVFPPNEVSHAANIVREIHGIFVKSRL